MDEAERISLRLHWPALMRELGARTARPIYHPSFVIFFLVVIVGVVPTGFWIELYSYCTSAKSDSKLLRASIISVVPAFVAATSMQLIWAESARKLRAVAILVLSVCMLGLVFCGSAGIVPEAGISLGIVSAVLAFWLWWVANANQVEFLDEPSPTSFNNPVGGDVDSSIPLAGNLDGFVTE
ncbi:hypothetical protein [Janthinobacterium sp. PSPC1-1]|uniref:hypothetical protein n=1 Tax=Janthinobacterium sp. PSPC1-1 TaxID=2804581 RepID=UPI003CEDEFF8